MNLPKEIEKFVKASWIFSNVIYLIIIDKKYEKHIKEKMKNYNLIIIQTEDFFKSIMEYDTKLLISIRDGKILFDPFGVVGVIKRSVKKGIIAGTKESLFRKFMIIHRYLNEIENIKYHVFNNIYMSVVECGQAALIARGYPISIPRDIPKHMKKYFLGNGLEKTHITYCEEIIKLYKKFEHGKTHLPNGRKLDELAKKAEIFRNAVKSIL
ncbi:MAG: hypothetical protein QXD48_00760 [Candidatus Aenigmatarchaeota archaeon]